MKATLAVMTLEGGPLAGCDVDDLLEDTWKLLTDEEKQLVLVEAEQQFVDSLTEGERTMLIARQKATGGENMNTRLLFDVYVEFERVMMALDNADNPLAENLRDVMDQLWDSLTEDERTMLRTNREHAEEERG